MGLQSCRSVPSGVVLAAIVSLAGCKGEGFDIGPRIEKLPDDSFRAFVRDDAGKAVVNARVTLSTDAGRPVWTSRDGLADFFHTPSGRVIAAFDMNAALAEQGDFLAGLTVVFDAVPRDQLLATIHVADVSGSSGLPLVAGALAATATLDDSATSGAVLVIPAGTIVGFGAATNDTLRSGSLRHDHVPPLRLTDGRAALVTRGVQLHPASSTFAPGAHLTVPNDIALPANGTAELFELGPADGEWRVIGRGTADATATLITTTAPVVTRAALLAFAVAAPAIATIRGRLLETDGRTVVARARVRAGQVVAESGSDGRFELQAVPVGGADGTSRQATLTFAGGRTRRPAAFERSFAAIGGQALDAGDLTFDLEGVTDLRALAIARGQVQPFVTVGLGSADRGNGDAGVSRADGTIEFPAIDDRFVGFLATTPDPTNVRRVFSLDGRVFVPASRRNLDLLLFYGTEEWTADNRGGAVVVPIDDANGARVTGAYVHRQRGGSDEFLDQTREDNDLRAAISGATEIVASLETNTDGVRVLSAHSANHVDVRRVELPLLRAQRAPLGAFVPFGVLHGDLRAPLQPGSGIPLATLWRVVATGIENADRWLDAALAGRSLAPATPVWLDPAQTGGSLYRGGLPSRGAHVAMTWGDLVLGRHQISALALMTDIALAPGSTTEFIPTGMTALYADTDFRATGALAGFDAAIPGTAVRTDLAYVLADGRAIEVVRTHDGNLTALGEDAVLRLPATFAPPAGGHWLAVIGGTADVGGVILTQRAVFALDGTTHPRVPQLAVPSIDTPLHAQQVSANGFEARFTVPPESLYVTVRLHGESAGEIRDWRAIVPPDLGTFTFRVLPRGPAILAPGQYTLEVTAVRIDDGPVHQQYFPGYQAVASRIFGIGAWERRVDALASRRITIEIVP